jgi:hypothetical protein
MPAGTEQFVVTFEIHLPAINGRPEQTVTARIMDVPSQPTHADLVAWVRDVEMTATCQHRSNYDKGIGGFRVGGFPQKWTTPDD